MTAVDPLRSVLIVEDDGDFAESLADMLVPRGFSPVIAGGAEAAMAIMNGAPGDEPGQMGQVGGD